MRLRERKVVKGLKDLAKNQAAWAVEKKELTEKLADTLVYIYSGRRKETAAALDRALDRSEKAKAATVAASTAANRLEVAFLECVSV